jgi:hypothetical protein
MRLHITPLNAELLPAVLGPNLIHSATNVSYHSIQSSPENNYGYLELPTMDAEKVKKKLHGAILKGKRIKVEEARPQKRKRAEESTDEAVMVKVNTSQKKVKSRGKERNVVPGHELAAQRKIKRGWTEAKESKSDKKQKAGKSSMTSKYSDKDELLFRTKLPENKKGKVKTRKPKGEQIVHEFEKTTKYPSFLRDSGSGLGRSMEYVEGTGWINEQGEVVEPESKRVRAGGDRMMPNQSGQPSLSSSSSASASGDEEPNVTAGVSVSVSVVEEDETSSSGTSSDSDQEEEDEDNDDNDGDAAAATAAATGDVEEKEEEEEENEKEEQAESVTPVSGKVCSSSTNGQDVVTSEQVHPLEALFKKPGKPASQDVAKPSLEISTSFSLFDGDGQNDLEDEPAIPGTPFSSQDMQSRDLRSAAPTPDTAHAARFNSWESTGTRAHEDPNVDDDDESDEKRSVSGKRSVSKLSRNAAASSRNQSDFEKTFWETRGDNNRAWKARRRAVLKEKRQRENKARRPKNW